MIPPDRIAAAVAAYVAGDSLRAAATGRCSPTALRRHLAAQGIPLRSRGGDQFLAGRDERRAEMVQALAECGGSYVKLGERYGITRTGAWLAINRKLKGDGDADAEAHHEGHPPVGGDADDARAGRVVPGGEA